MFHTFSLLLHLSWWSVLSDDYNRSEVPQSLPIKDGELTDCWQSRTSHRLSWWSSGRVWEDAANSERSSTVGQEPSENTACHSGIVHGKKRQRMQQTSLLCYFRELPQPPQPSAATTLISQQPSTSRQEAPSAKRLWLAKDLGTVSIFYQ